MAEILDLIDLDELRHQVREKYRDVAADPAGTQHPHHFHTGRSHAIRLGYPAYPLSELPDEACEAFAGVGNPFYWCRPNRTDSQPRRIPLCLRPGDRSEKHTSELQSRTHLISRRLF